MNERLPVFLSASFPSADRDPEFWRTHDRNRIRDAIVALAAEVLPNRPLVFGGHPTITPLVRAVADRVKAPRNHILLYQSEHFWSKFPDDVRHFDAVQMIEAVHDDWQPAEPDHGNRANSLTFMRLAMVGCLDRLSWVLEQDIPHHLVGLATAEHLLSPVSRWIEERKRRLGTDRFAAAVLIGGMEGTFEEFDLFARFDDTAPLLPIASTGANAMKMLTKFDAQIRARLPETSDGIGDAGDIVAFLRDDDAYGYLFGTLFGRHQ